MRSDEPEIVAALVKVAWPIILEYFEKRSCIASTRIGIDVLNYFGVKAEPLPLLMMVFNDEAIRLLEEGKTMLEIGALAAKESPDTPGGPWTIGVGAEIENSPDWAGHVVIALPHAQAIIDLSSDQYSRPLKNLDFDEPLALRIDDPTWWTGESRRHIAVVTAGEGGPHLGLVFDHDVPDAMGYRRSRNWRRDSSVLGRSVFKDITGRIIREMKQEIDQ